MAAALEPGEDDEAEEVPKVQAFSRRVEAAVDFKGAHARVGARGPDSFARDGLNEAPLLEDAHHVWDPSSGVQVPSSGFERRLGGGLREAPADQEGKVPAVP